MATSIIESKDKVIFKYDFAPNFTDEFEVNTFLTVEENIEKIVKEYENRDITSLANIGKEKVYEQALYRVFPISVIFFLALYVFVLQGLSLGLITFWGIGVTMLGSGTISTLIEKVYVHGKRINTKDERKLSIGDLKREAERFMYSKRIQNRFRMSRVLEIMDNEIKYLEGLERKIKKLEEAEESVQDPFYKKEETAIIVKKKELREKAESQKSILEFTKKWYKKLDTLDSLFHTMDNYEELKEERIEHMENDRTVEYIELEQQYLLETGLEESAVEKMQQEIEQSINQEERRVLIKALSNMLSD